MFGLSILGIVHTLISLIAVVAALTMLVSEGRITLQGGLGRTYLIGTTIGCLTAFGLSSHGGFNPGHALALLTLVCLIGAVIVERLSMKGWSYIQVVLLSTSLFFALVPGITETLTRLPLSQPLATGPEDPLVLKALGTLALVFLTTLIIQLIFVRKHNQLKAAKA